MWWQGAGPDYRIRCADERVDDGKTTEVKWESIFLEEAEAWADAKWRAEVTADTSSRGRWARGNKLRTYALLKERVVLEPYLCFSYSRP